MTEHLATAGYVCIGAPDVRLVEPVKPKGLRRTLSQVLFIAGLATALGLVPVKLDDLRGLVEIRVVRGVIAALKMRKFSGIREYQLVMVHRMLEASADLSRPLLGSTAHSPCPKRYPGSTLCR